jgi:hypothetical protein
MSQVASQHVQLLRHLYDKGDMPLHLAPHIHKILTEAQTDDHAVSLMRQQNMLTGGGLLNWLSKKATQVKEYASTLWKGVRIDYPPDVRTALSEMGAQPIKAMFVCRTPVEKYVQTMINFVSMGKFSELKGKMPYDDLYHVFLVFSTPVGMYLLEKNEVIVLKPYTSSEENKRKSTTGYGSMVVPVLREDTLLNILNRARSIMGENNFFTYNAFSNNCQNFLNSIMSAAGQLGDVSYTTAIQQFVFQPVEQLAQNLSSFTKTFAQTTTNLAHRVNILLKGRGFTPHHANQIAQVFQASGPYVRKKHIDELEAGSFQGIWHLSNMFESDKHSYLRSSEHPQQLKDRLHVLNNQAGTTEFFNNFIDHPTYIQQASQQQQATAEATAPYVEFVNGFAIDPNDIMTAEEAELAKQQRVSYIASKMLPTMEPPSQAEP